MTPVLGTGDFAGVRFPSPAPHTLRTERAAVVVSHSPHIHISIIYEADKDVGVSPHQGILYAGMVELADTSGLSPGG